MASFLKKFAKPPLTGLLKKIPSEVLDKQLTDEDLHIIAKQMVNWEDKAHYLGLHKTEVQDIEKDHKHSNKRQRIEMLRMWKEKKAYKATLRELLRCSSQHGWTTFGCSICKELGHLKEDESNNVKTMRYFCKKHCLLVLCIVAAITAVVASICAALIFHPAVPIQNHGLPSRIHNLVGRQKEMSELKLLLEYSPGTPKIVSITGGPGFGKSALAISIGHDLKDEGVKVSYVNLNEDITGKSELAKNIMKLPLSTERSISMQELYQWSGNLKDSTLLILDNCDEQIYTSKDDLQYIISKLVKQSKHLKILTTSRRQVTYIEAHKLFPITELSISHACELLRGIVQSLDGNQCADIARLTGSVPLALHVVGALLDMPNPPSPQRIVNQLNESLIRTLSPEELQTADTVNASIFLSYQYLEKVAQKTGRYLSFFPGSFSNETACAIIKNFPSSDISPCEIPGLLVKRSLLKSVLFISESDNVELKAYEYHRLIGEFFKEMSYSKELEAFNINFIKHYTSELKRLSESNFQGINPFHYLFTTRQEIRHFFYLLSSNATFPRVYEKEARIIMKAANTVSSINMLEFGFSPYETQQYVKDLLSYFNVVVRDLTKYFTKKRFFEIYSKIVVHLARAEKMFISDKNVLIQSMKAYRWAFLKYGQLMPSGEYISYFSTLSNYYIEINKYDKAIRCHEKILLKENLLEKCDGECSVLQLAEAFERKQDKKASRIFLNRQLELQLQAPITQDTLKTLETMDILCQLYAIYSAYSNLHNMKQVVERLAEITSNIVLTPLETIEHIQLIIKTAAILQSMDVTSELSKLNNYLQKGIHETEEVHFIIKKLSDLPPPPSGLVYFEILVFIGENVLELLEEQHMTYLRYKFRPWILKFTGDILYRLQNYTGSLLHYRELVKLPEYKQPKVCFRLLNMGSFECLPQLVSLMISNTLRSLHSVYDTINSLCSLSSSSSTQHVHIIDNDYLSNDLTSKYETEVAIFEDSAVVNNEKTPKLKFDKMSFGLLWHFLELIIFISYPCCTMYYCSCACRNCPVTFPLCRPQCFVNLERIYGVVMLIILAYSYINTVANTTLLWP